MADDDHGVRTFKTVAMARHSGGHVITIPFDPAVAWGAWDRFHVHGMLGGHPYRGALDRTDDGWTLQLGPAWCRTPGFSPGDEVTVLMGPEGPHSTTMGPDVAAAFAEDPVAARFFDSLPSFYRNNYARWIADARRRETRDRRIGVAVDRSRKGERER